MISIEITFDQENDNVKALLIQFPEGFIHNIQKASDVLNENPDFPIAEGEWAYYGSLSAIKILVQETTSLGTIPVGTYSFSFPVQVPGAGVPRINVWRLSMCESATCRDHEDPEVLVSFPIAGFNIGQVMTNAEKTRVT